MALAAGFYSGPTGEAIVAALQQRGGVLAAEDLAAHRTAFVDPISTTYRGHRVYEVPPPTQVGSVGSNSIGWMQLTVFLLRLRCWSGRHGSSSDCRCKSPVRLVTWGMQTEPTSKYPFAPGHCSAHGDEHPGAGARCRQPALGLCCAPPHRRRRHALRLRRRPGIQCRLGGPVLALGKISASIHAMLHVRCAMTTVLVHVAVPLHSAFCIVGRSYAVCSAKLSGSSSLYSRSTSMPPPTGCGASPSGPTAEQGVRRGAASCVQG